MANLGPASVPLTRPITRVDLNRPARDALMAAANALHTADRLLSLQGCSASDPVRFAVRCALGNVEQGMEKVDERL